MRPVAARAGWGIAVWMATNGWVERVRRGAGGRALSAAEPLRERGCPSSGCLLSGNALVVMRQISTGSMARGREGCKRAGLWRIELVLGTLKFSGGHPIMCAEVGHDCEGEGRVWSGVGDDGKEFGRAVQDEGGGAEGAAAGGIFQAPGQERKIEN